MTPEYARRSNGQIEIRSAHGWHPVSGLAAATDLAVLMNYPEVHRQKIEELKEALREPK